MSVKWSGSNICNLCHVEVNLAGKTFYDCATAFGKWALLCKECFLIYGRNIGQVYDSETREKIRNLHSEC